MNMKSDFIQPVKSRWSVAKEYIKQRCLRHFGMEDETERGDRFWNTNSVEMKFSTEKE